jgi:hypothetical protein
LLFYRTDPAALHQHVDITKTVGIGPAVSFACSYLDIQDATVLSDASLSSIRLIPAAIGATSLNEWMPHYIHSSPSFTMHGKVISSIYKPPKSATYYNNCVNILSCAFRSLFLSLYSSYINTPNTTSSLSGLIWYQGCNDALSNVNEEYSENTSQTYLVRLTAVFSSSGNLRDKLTTI